MKKFILVFVLFGIIPFACRKSDDLIPPLPNEEVENLPIRISFLKSKLDENSNNHFIAYLLAKDYLKQGNISKSLIYIRKAIAIEPKKKYLIVLSECFYKKGLYLDAFDVLNQLNINDLSDMEFSLKAIDIFLHAKNFEKANELIDSKLAQDSLNADLLYKKSEIKLQAKDTLASILFCKKSIEIDSTFKPALNQLVYLNFKIKSYDLVIQYATKSLILDSTDIEMYLTKAKAMEFLNQKEKSVALFEKILTIDSTNLDELHGTANYLLQNKKYVDAFKLFKKVELYEPNSPNLSFNLATALHYSGSKVQALDYYLKVDSSSKNFKNAEYMIKKIKQRRKE